MADMQVPDTAGDEPLSLFDRNHTSGAYRSESESASALDRCLTDLGFTVFHEVTGTLLHPRPGQVERGLRLDRVLVPKKPLVEGGWALGAIGIEAKRSGVKLGPAFAQAMDYVHAAWFLPGLVIHLGAVFVWPAAKQYGPLSSILTQNRVGTCSLEWGRFRMWLDQVILEAGNLTDYHDQRGLVNGVRIADYGSGRRAGSR